MHVSLRGALRVLVPSLCAFAAACAAPEKAEPAAPAPTAPAATFDLQGFIDARVAAGDRVVTLPPGRHLVTPRNRQHLLLRDLSDLVIDGAGAELVCTETTRAITIENCENLVLRNLVIDYDPLPFTQTRVLSVSDDKTRLEVETIPGYADPVAGSGKLEIFDPATNRLRGRVTYYDTRIEPAGPGRATLTRSANLATRADELPGDIAVLYRSHAPGGEIPHTLFASDCRDLLLENVTLYAGVTFGFFENGCEGSRYLGCRVDRRPADLDPVARAHPRVRSVNADAYHSKNARRGPHYERCVARFNGDDSIAINGDYHFVTAARDATLRVLAKHAMTLRVGDTLQIFTYDGRRLEDRKVLSLTPAGSATDEERRLIAAQQMNESLQRRAMRDAWDVVLDAPAGDVPPGSLVASAESIGSGFVIRDCQLGENRARGILVKAGRGEITGNRIEGTILTAILVSPEFWWLEAGLADHLRIEGNTIVGARGMGIVVLAVGGDGSLARPGAFRDIAVRDNTVSGGPAPGLLLASIRGLVNERNTIATDPAKSINPWELRDWARARLGPVMLLDNE